MPLDVELHKIDVLPIVLLSHLGQRYRRHLDHFACFRRHGDDPVALRFLADRKHDGAATAGHGAAAQGDLPQPVQLQRGLEKVRHLRRRLERPDATLAADGQRRRRGVHAVAGADIDHLHSRPQPAAHETDFVLEPVLLLEHDVRGDLVENRGKAQASAAVDVKNQRVVREARATCRRRH